MKKVLYLSQLFPSPPDSGGKIKTLNTVLTLAKKYEVFAVFISEEKPKPADIKVLTNAGIKMKIFYSATILASVKDDLLGLAKNFMRGIPHYVFQYTHEPAEKFIRAKIQSFQPDVIHADHLNMAQYLPSHKKQTWILEHHNVETYLYWTRFVHTTKPARKLYLFIEMLLTYFFERRWLPRFDRVFAISEPERKRLKRIFGATNVITQPLVFPAKPVKHAPSSHPTILFVGTLGWPPNEDAVGWFVRDMFPMIERKIPNVQFHVVGRSHPPFEKTLPRRKNIFLHGYQKNLTPFLARADVFVLPFRMGGGVRLKALTGLAAGLPIVTTPLGVEGLEVHHNNECLISDTAENLSVAICQVLQSPKLSKQLRKNALQYIAQKHSPVGNTQFLRQYAQGIQK